MHELAIAQGLIYTAEEIAQREGESAVSAVHCRIGVLRGVNDALLRDAFEVARMGTLCETATLIVEKIPMQALCGMCQLPYAIHDWDWRCPNCGRIGAQLSGGDELELVRVEVCNTRPPHPSADFLRENADQMRSDHAAAPIEAYRSSAPIVFHSSAKITTNGNEISGVLRCEMDVRPCGSNHRRHDAEKHFRIWENCHAQN